MSVPKISIIIPTLNEEENIGRLLDYVDSNCADAEVIVVDGGSTDRTCDMVGERARFVTGLRGRGRQLNLGASRSRGEILWFLHADCLPHAQSFRAIMDVTSKQSVVGGGFRYSFFDERMRFRIFCWWSNLKNVVSRRVFGDMGIFVRREVFFEMGRFPNTRLMEDFEFGRRLKRYGRVKILPHRLKTSARDWHREGFMRKIAKDFLVKLAYLCNAPDERLYRWYYGGEYEPD